MFFVAWRGDRGEAVRTGVITVLFLGETLLPLQLIGGAVVLLGVWLAT